MNASELATLIDTHAAALVLYARQWSAAPEDVVQEAFLKLMEARKPPPNSVAWLYRVVRHRAIDAGRVARRRQQREARVARPEGWFVEPAVDGLDAAAAVAALEQLPGEQREVIVARLWGGLNFEQLAAVIGCSVSTAYRRFEAGIQGLREVLKIPCRTQ